MANLFDCGLLPGRTSRLGSLKFRDQLARIVDMLSDGLDRPCIALPAQLRARKRFHLAGVELQPDCRCLGVREQLRDVGGIWGSYRFQRYRDHETSRRKKRQCH